MISSFPDLKIIIAPHEIHQEHLSYVKNIFPDSVLFSELKTSNRQPATNCLIIDNIGMLSKLYRYSTITYIGGGFDKGIHNVLEAAVFGKPVIFGPRHEKFKEAIDLINAGAGFNVNSKAELIAQVGLLLNDNNVYQKSCESAKGYVYKNGGATEIIVKYIQENRLFTN